MPVYDYKCKECEHVWEENHSMNDPDILVCPKCGKESAKKLISLGSFILQGGGWAIDRYH